MASLQGEKVCISRLNEENRQDYLTAYKAASNFHDLYEQKSDLWAYMCREIGAIEDSSERYLIREVKTDLPCGYIDIDVDLNRPAIDIAFAPLSRNKGYGYEAAWLLCRAFFERSPDEALIWNAFPKNIYSRRIAEKLGGQQIDVRDVFTETVRKAYSLSEGGMAKLPNVIVYEIRKAPFEKST